MPEHMHDQMEAFLDGELDEYRLAKVQVHLETCAACRDELEELRDLSRLLHAAPQPAFIPAAAFRDRLMVRLPPRDEDPAPRPGSRMLLWLAPAAVLAGWAFVRVGASLSTLLTLVNRAGLLDGAAAWAAGAPQQMRWFPVAQTLLGGLLSQPGESALQVINAAGVFNHDVLVSLLWQGGTAALYGLALLLAWRSRRPLERALPAEQ